MIQWQPYCVKKPFDPKTPVCSACKKTNRTRSFCRERHKHRQLPWCTVYVLLSPADTIDPATRVAPESIPHADDDKSADPNKAVGVKGVEGEIKPENIENKLENPVTTQELAPSGETVKPQKKSSGEEGDEGDDINEIAESRTFLAKVSCRHSSVHWLELAEFDASDSAAVHGIVAPDGHMAMARSGMPMQPMDPSQYYAHAMGGYAAQQHQFNLKSHQQYFFQMQQRTHQQYAAQQAAWQQQYNQQSSMQLQHATGQPPAGAPAAGAPAPVTAGEAAAQQSNQQPEQSAGAAAAAASQQQGHAQWAYHQQMYQNQMAQFQQTGGVVPPQGGQQNTAPEQPVDYSQQAHTDTDDIEPSPVHGDEHDDRDENEAKRTRYV
jgi:hypothetical protein